MLDVFEVAIDLILENEHVWTQTAISHSITGIHWQIVNSARVALNSTRTAANRAKFMEESASWPVGTNGNVIDYVDAVTDMITVSPSKDWSWVSPVNDPPTRNDLSGALTTNGFSQAANVEDAPASADLIGRDWISDIP